MRWTCQHGSVVDIAGDMAVSGYLCSLYEGGMLGQCFWVAVDPIRPDPEFTVNEVPDIPGMETVIENEDRAVLHCVHEWRVITNTQGATRNSILYTFYCIHCLETKRKAIEL
jgi:hypothetical protein